jgi:hypothetical protein
LMFSRLWRWRRGGGFLVAAPEAVPPPHTVLKCGFQELYSLPCCLPRKWLLSSSNHTSRTSAGKQQRNGYISLILHYSREDGSSAASETLISRHRSTWSKMPESHDFHRLRVFKNR